MPQQDSFKNTNMETPKKTNKRLNQIKRGLTEFSILTIINSGEYLFYAESIRERLEETGFSTPKGTLYPALRKLMCEKIIGQYYDESDLGTPRKHYFLTEKGKSLYTELDQYWKEINKTLERLKKPTDW